MAISILRCKLLFIGRLVPISELPCRNFTLLNHKTPIPGGNKLLLMRLVDLPFY